MKRWAHCTGASPHGRLLKVDIFMNGFFKVLGHIFPRSPIVAREVDEESGPVGVRDGRVGGHVPVGLGHEVFPLFFVHETCDQLSLKPRSGLCNLLRRIQ